MIWDLRPSSKSVLAAVLGPTWCACFLNQSLYFSKLGGHGQTRTVVPRMQTENPPTERHAHIKTLGEFFVHWVNPLIPAKPFSTLSALMHSVQAGTAHVRHGVAKRLTGETLSAIGKPGGDLPPFAFWDEAHCYAKLLVAVAGVEPDFQVMSLM